MHSPKLWFRNLHLHSEIRPSVGFGIPLIFGLFNAIDGAANFDYALTVMIFPESVVS